MNKRELTAQVASKTGLTYAQSGKAISAVFQSIKESLERSESTQIKSFGSFSISHHSERMGVNPVTREAMTIPARKMVKFSASTKVTIK